MVAKVHESFDAGQFLTGSLTHFTVTHTAAVDMKVLVETASTRATVVILGADGGRIAVENNGAWTAASLEAALGAGYTVADFDY
jgi:hypothetical protein